jgi:hypothetical protein
MSPSLQHHRKYSTAMTDYSTSNDTNSHYLPFMIGSRDVPSSLSKHNDSQYTTTARLPRKPSRPALPSMISTGSDQDNRSTWWSTKERASTIDAAYPSSEHLDQWEVMQDNEDGGVVDEDGQSPEYVSVCSSKLIKDRQNTPLVPFYFSKRPTTAATTTTNDSRAALVQSPMSDTIDMHQEEEIRELWSVASTLLTRPPTSLSYSDQLNSKYPRKQWNIMDDRRTAGTTSRMGHDVALTVDSSMDPCSIATGIVDYVDHRQVQWDTRTITTSMLRLGLTPTLKNRASNPIPRKGMWVAKSVTGRGSGFSFRAFLAS